MTPTEPTELETALIAGLAIRSDELTKATLDMKDSILDLKNATRVTRTMSVVVVVGMVLLVGLTVIAWQNRSNGQAVRTNTARIRSCTTPGGDCYERGQKTTGKAVAQIVAAVNAHTDLVFLATLECQHRLDHSDAAFERCMHAKGVR